MKIQDIKNLTAYAERFWRQLPKAVQPEIIIENDISGTFESETSRVGSKQRRFKPWTNNPVWSSWRVGIPVRWKGKTLILWVRGYHCEIGEPIMWLTDCIWNVDTNKPLRKDASINCWDQMKAASKKASLDVSDIKLTRWSRPFQSDGWNCEHNGISWGIYPAASYIKDYEGIQPVTDEPRTYWVQHNATEYPATHCDSLKEAKAFIKFESGEWLSKRKF